MSSAPDPNPAPGLVSAPDLASPSHKKRSRIRFSCTTCREKKLKCNRQLPCDQCVKRGLDAACRIVPYEGVSSRGSSTHGRGRQHEDLAAADGDRKRPVASDAALQARIRHLERLVQVLKSRCRDGADVDSVDPELAPNNRDDACDVADIEASESKPMMEDGRYVDPTNWEAALEEVAQLTEGLTTVDESEDEENDLVDDIRRPGPVLLLGGFPSVPLFEMARFLPPRPVADRFISRFFQMDEPGWVMFHMPTLLRDYDIWMKDPSRMTYTQLALIYALFSQCALFCASANEPVPGNLGNPMEVFKAYMHRAAHCLVLDDYTKPAPYKVEAMILYFGCEYMAHADCEMGCAIVLTIAVRLAMAMGMHRDPKHYVHLTPFEAEMRRRIWMVLRDIDNVVAFEFGLPSTIHLDYIDTEPPSNLHDEDFGPDSKELPPSRPETERTRALYMRTKHPLLNAFMAASLATSSAQSLTSYASVLRLDKINQDAYNSIPPSLRYRTFDQSVLDHPSLILQRYYLEMTMLKTRMVLHRRFISLAHKDRRFEYSRRACIDAAVRMLKHQYDLQCEAQAGGRLANNKWYHTNGLTHTFLLANMVLSLELAHTKNNAPDTQGEAPQETYSRGQLLQILQTSRQIWESVRKQSAPANRGYQVLTKMLAKATSEKFASSPESGGSDTDSLPAGSAASSHPSITASSDTRSWGMPDKVNDGAFVNPTMPASSSSAATSSSSGHYLPDPTFTANTQNPPEPTAAWTPGSSYVEATHLTDEIPPMPWDGRDMMGVAAVGPMDFQFGAAASPDAPIGAQTTDSWFLWDNQIQNSANATEQIPWDSFFQHGVGHSHS